MDMILLFAETADGRWRPGIGDPTVIGWVTVGAYFLTTLACFRAFRRTLPAKNWLFWLLMTIVMAALGVNKQLDLQTLVTELGRDYLRSIGDYENRRTYQVRFIWAVTALCAGCLPIAFWLLRGHIREQWPAVVGIIFLLGFIVIRACSFHHMDAFLGASIGGVKWNWIFELGGIAMIGFGALRVRKTSFGHASGNPGLPPVADATGSP